MAAYTTYLESQILTHLLRTGSWTKPTTLYVALFTAAPSDSGGGTEVSGGSYARVARNPLDANWSAPAKTTYSESHNAAVIDFGTATANWGTITHFGIYDASSSGNLLLWGALSSSKTVNSGDAFQISASQLVLTLD
jgi:hypothetical protein